MEREGRVENLVNRKRLNIVARSVAAIGIVAAGAAAVEKSDLLDLLDSPIDSTNHLVSENLHGVYDQLIAELPKIKTAEAQSPPDIVCCNGKTITVVGGNPVTGGDLQYVYDVLQGLVNNSANFRTYVSQSTKDSILVYVYKNTTQILGGAETSGDNSNIVAIDLADNEVIGDYLEGAGITDGDRVIVYFGKDKQTLAHEFGHLNGTLDPHLKENPVLVDIGAGWTRDYYGACNVDDGHAISGISVGSHSGYIDATAWDTARRAAGGMWPSANLCSVGGIAELPEVSELPQNTTSEKSKDNTIPIAAGLAAAAASLTTTGVVLYFRRNRSV